MDTASVTIRVDQHTKECAARIAEDFGFDLSSVTRAFYRQMVREQRIPLSLEYPRPTSESLASVRDSEKIIEKGVSRFENAEDMFEALGI